MTDSNDEQTRPATDCLELRNMHILHATVVRHAPSLEAACRLYARARREIDDHLATCRYCKEELSVCHA